MFVLAPNTFSIHFFLNIYYTKQRLIPLLVVWVPTSIVRHQELKTKRSLCDTSSSSTVVKKYIYSQKKNRHPTQRTTLAHLAALALEVLHPLLLVGGAELHHLLPAEVERRSSQAPLVLAAPRDHVVHARVLVRGAEARPLVPLVPVRGLPLTPRGIAPVFFFCQDFFFPDCVFRFLFFVFRTCERCNICRYEKVGAGEVGQPFRGGGARQSETTSYPFCALAGSTVVLGGGSKHLALGPLWHQLKRRETASIDISSPWCHTQTHFHTRAAARNPLSFFTCGWRR